MIADASVHSQENGYDFVVIYDNGIEVTRITGSQLPAPIRTSSLLTVRPLLGPKAALAASMPREGPLRVSRFVNETCLQVALTSDGSLQRRGFSANFAPTVRAFTEAALLGFFVLAFGTTANAFAFGSRRKSFVFPMPSSARRLAVKGEPAAPDDGQSPLTLASNVARPPDAAARIADEPSGPLLRPAAIAGTAAGIVLGIVGLLILGFVFRKQVALAMKPLRAAAV